MYILSQGEIEIYLPSPDNDIVIDTLSNPGSVLSQFTCLDEIWSLTFSARTTCPTICLVISKEKIYQTAEKFPDLRSEIKDAKLRIKEKGFPIVDY
jgi:CRP-like cAMP-binding protein